MKNTAENRLLQRQMYFNLLDNATIKEYPEINAVIYIGNDNKNKPSATGFTGTAGKPDFNYYFTSEERREKFISEWLQEQKNKIAYKEERKAKKQAPAIFELPYKIGDIIYNSWGYDQTNIDFYQVVRCTKSSLFIKPIQSEYTDKRTGNSMAAYVRPVKDSFTGEEIRKKLQWYDSKAYINFEFGGGCRWQEGQEVYCSWYA